METIVVPRRTWRSPGNVRSSCSRVASRPERDCCPSSTARLRTPQRAQLDSVSRRTGPSDSVAHCLARERLGLLTRESVASVVSMTNDTRRVLAGTGTAYRADEVAAAAIRYPLGLAGALRKCAAQELPATSFFRSPSYAESRWIWFNIWSDRPQSNLADLDDAELRALALEEW